MDDVILGQYLDSDVRRNLTWNCGYTVRQLMEVVRICYLMQQTTC